MEINGRGLVPFPLEPGKIEVAILEPQNTAVEAEAPCCLVILIQAFILSTDLFRMSLTGTVTVTWRCQTATNIPEGI